MVRHPVIKGFAALAMLIGWTLLTAPALVDVVERLTGRGGNIGFILRIHFTYATGLVLLGLLYFLVARPSTDRRMRWLATAFALQAVVLIGVWLLDSKDFLWEISAVTFFTALTILTAAALAALNVPAARAAPDSHRLAGIFWTLIALAFLLAGLDEYFTIHERVGTMFEPLTQRLNLPVQFFQDGVTIAYAVGAPLFIWLFFRCFRAELLRDGQMAGWLLIAGIGTFAVAVMNDTLDFVGEAWFPLLNPFHAMNFAEEVLELSAGVFFASAFAIALLERRPQVFDELLGQPANAPLLRRAAAALLALSLAGALLVPLALRLTGTDRSLLVQPAQDFEVSLFADARAGLDSVDELIFVPGLGLIAGNEATGELLVFDSDGKASVLVSGLTSPDGLAFDGSLIYAADELADSVRRYDTDGTGRGEIAGILNPEGVAVASDGTVYVADGARRLVVAVRGDGHEVIASTLDGLGSPEQLALDAAGNLYIADERKRAVFRRTPGGSISVFADAGDGIVTPETIVVHEGHLYVSDSGRSVIHRYDLNGTGGVYLRFAKKYDLAGLAFDADGVMYQAIVSEYRAHNRIVRIAPVHGQSQR